jgi:hypothetical protein
MRALCGKDGRRYSACREGYLKAVFLGRFVVIYAAYVASRLVAGLILFASAATERELLVVGMTVCLLALLGWHVARWRTRRAR